MEKNFATNRKLHFTILYNVTTTLKIHRTILLLRNNEIMSLQLCSSILRTCVEIFVLTSVEFAAWSVIPRVKTTIWKLYCSEKHYYCFCLMGFCQFVVRFIYTYTGIRKLFSEHKNYLFPQTFINPNCVVFEIHNKDKNVPDSHGKQVKRQIFLFLIHIRQVYPQSPQQRSSLAKHLFLAANSYIPFH